MAKNLHTRGNALEFLQCSPTGRCSRLENASSVWPILTSRRRSRSANIENQVDAPFLIYLLRVVSTCPQFNTTRPPPKK